MSSLSGRYAASLDDGPSVVQALYHCPKILQENEKKPNPGTGINDNSCTICKQKVKRGGIFNQMGIEQKKVF